MKTLQPQHEKNRRFWRPTLATTAIMWAIGAGAMSAHAAPDVPFLTSAYTAAQKKPDNPGISATITMTTLGAASSGPKVLIAQGPLRMEGDLLGGRLPMTFSDASTVAPGAHSLFFNVSQSGRIGLQWLVDDKPLEGKSMQSFDTEATQGTLTKKLIWNGASRLVTVSIERKLGFMPIPQRPFPRPRPRPTPVRIPGGRIVVLPKATPTPKPMIIIAGVAKPKATGRKVRVTGRFVVTNSDDGMTGAASDKFVEMRGSISLGQQRALNFNKTEALRDRVFPLQNVSVTLLYSDPNHRFFSISGRIEDHDSGSADDPMWFANQNIDLIQIMESNQEFRIKGDRNSESGDLYIRVVDEGEVF